MPIHYDCVGFDLDGTLLHTGPELADAMNHALTWGGHQPIAREAAISLIGGGAEEMIERALANLMKDADSSAVHKEMQRLYPTFFKHYTAHLGSESPLYPGLLELMDRIESAGIQMAVATNKAEHLARPLLEKAGIAHRFAAIIGGDSLGPNTKKPKPDMLLAMAAVTGSRKPLFIGDTAFDINAAKAANTASVAVRFGYSTYDVDTLGADLVISHYDELWDWLESED